MNTLSTPVGHQTLKRNEIKPSISAAFSPNLYRWMMRYGHEFSDGGVAETIYRVIPNSRLANEYGAGTLFIGCPYNQHEKDADFSGSQIMTVLCNGSKATRYCLAGAMRSLEVVENFWDLYLQIGRCAIDPDHNEHFLGNDRYSVSGDVRTCLWCGKKHQKIVVPKTTFEEDWIQV